MQSADIGKCIDECSNNTCNGWAHCCMLYIDFIDFKTNPQSCEFTQPVGHRLKPHTVKYYAINTAMILVTNLQEHLNPCRTWNKHWQEGKPWVTNDTTQTWRTWQFSKKGGGRAKETLSFDGEKRKKKSFPWPSDDWTKIPNPTYPKALRQTDREWKGRRWGQTVISAFSASPIFSSLFNYSPHDTSETRAKVLELPSLPSSRAVWCGKGLREWHVS